MEDPGNLAGKRRNWSGSGGRLELESVAQAKLLESLTRMCVRMDIRFDQNRSGKGTNMPFSFSLRFMTRILWVGVVALFVVSEIVTVLAFRKIPNDHLFPGLGTKYVALFTVALPMVAGMNG